MKQKKNSGNLFSGTTSKNCTANTVIDFGRIMDLLRIIRVGGDCRTEGD